MGFELEKAISALHLQSVETFRDLHYLRGSLARKMLGLSLKPSGTRLGVQLRWASVLRSRALRNLSLRVRQVGSAFQLMWPYHLGVSCA